MERLRFVRGLEPIAADRFLGQDEYEDRMNRKLQKRLVEPLMKV